VSAVDLQNAIYDAVSAAVAPLPVYDNPTQVADPDNNDAFPFVTVGDATLSEWGDDCKAGFDAQVIIHTWSRAHHTLETKAVQGDIYTGLHRVDLMVGGTPVVLCEEQSRDALRDPDGVTVHGVSRYRVVWTPTP